MNYDDIKVNQNYRIKISKKRPKNWNASGMMDHYMGKVVKIRSKSAGTVRIVQIEDKQYSWAFSASDFEVVYQLPEELFEI